MTVFVTLSFDAIFELFVKDLFVDLDADNCFLDIDGDSAIEPVLSDRYEDDRQVVFVGFLWLVDQLRRCLDIPDELSVDVTIGVGSVNLAWITGIGEFDFEDRPLDFTCGSISVRSLFLDYA